MTRPNTNLTIKDNSLAIPASDINSDFMLGYIDFDMPKSQLGIFEAEGNLLTSLGNTSEREQGYMIIESIGDWYDRLRTNQATGFASEYESTTPGNNDSGYNQVNRLPFAHFSGSDNLWVAGNTYAGGTFSRWPDGSKYSIWDYDWNYIENYLRYGGRVTIFSTKTEEYVETSSDTVNLVNNLNRAKQKSLNIDAFGSQVWNKNNTIRDIVNTRQDCIAITAVPTQHLSGVDGIIERRAGGAGPGEGCHGPCDPPYEPGFLGPTFQFSYPNALGGNYSRSGRQLAGHALLPTDDVYYRNHGTSTISGGHPRGLSFRYEGGGNPVFSCYFFDARPSRYGVSKERFLELNLLRDVGENEMSYGIRGVTFKSNFWASNNSDGVGFTLKPSANGSQRFDLTDSRGNNFTSTMNPPATIQDIIGLNGQLYFVDSYGEYSSLDVEDKIKEDPITGSKKQDWFTQLVNSGLTYFQSLAETPVGRCSVRATAFDLFDLTQRVTQKPILTGGESSIGIPLQLQDIAMPANWETPFAWRFIPVGGPIETRSYEILGVTGSTAAGFTTGNVRFSFAPGRGSNEPRSGAGFDVRKTFDPDWNPVDLFLGTGSYNDFGNYGVTGSYYKVANDSYGSTVFGRSADHHLARKRNNIFSTSSTDLSDLAKEYWGCTCGGSTSQTEINIRNFIGELTGATPDICIDFGTKTSTTDVTAAGSSYSAYIAYSRPLPNIQLTGPLNVFGEFIGMPTRERTGGQGTTLSILLDNLNAANQDGGIPGEDVSFPRPTNSGYGGVGFIQNCKSFLFHPLEPIDSENLELGSTADKVGFFFATANGRHDAGRVNSLQVLRDPVWYSQYGRFFDDNLDTDYGVHWYSIANYQGGLLEQGVGVNPDAPTNNPNNFQQIDFFGATWANEQYDPLFGGSTRYVNNNGISGSNYNNEGRALHLLAEIEITSGCPLVGIGNPGLIPEQITNADNVTYESLFAQNSELFEFPVFGEKKTIDAFENASKQSVEEDLTEFNIIPFTSDVAGMFARQFRDLEPWFSPANSKVSSVQNIRFERYRLTDAEKDTLYNNKINYIDTSESPRLFGDKTFANSASNFSRVNVTNLFIYLKKNLDSLCKRFLFEQNDAESRASFVNAATQFLQEIQGSRGINNYRVICDETNNPPNVVDSNSFVADIFVQPTKTINFIRLKFTNTGSTFELE